MTQIESFLIRREKFLEIIVALSLSGFVTFVGLNSPWTAILDWFQFGLIATILIISMRDDEKYGSNPSRWGQATSQFVTFWRQLWWVWLALYLLFALRSTLEALYGGALPIWCWETGFNLAANLGNNIQSYWVLILFLVMTKKTTEGKPITKGFASRLVMLVITVCFAGELMFAIFAPKVITIAPSVTLSGADIKDIHSLASKLTNRVDSLSAYLYDNIPTNDQTLWLTLPSQNGDHLATRNRLASSLTNLLSSNSLYDVSRRAWTNREMGLETMKLVKKNPKGSDLARLNVLILQDFYPDEISDDYASKVTPDKSVWEAAGILFSIFSGLFGGVSFCLFFGRLGSHYIRLPYGWLAALFLYAAIQPLYPVVRIAGTYSLIDLAPLQIMQIVLKIMAAILKLILFLRVREILRDSRLQYFMFKVAADEEVIPRQQQEFDEALKASNVASPNEPNAS